MASKKRARRSEPLFGSENDETGSLKKRTDVVEPSHTWVDEVWGNVSSRASSRVRSNLRNLVTADVAAREAVRCGALEVDFSGGVSSATKLYHQYPLRLLCPRRVVDLTKYPTCDRYVLGLSQIRQHTVCPYKTDTFLSQTQLCLGIRRAVRWGVGLRGPRGLRGGRRGRKHVRDRHARHEQGVQALGERRSWRRCFKG